MVGEIRFRDLDLGPGVSAFFTSRSGGVSRDQWRGLNLAASGGDDPEAVTQNRALVSAEIQAPIVGMNQVHGDHVARVDASSIGRVPHTADGLITQDDEIALMVLVADCVPILLADSATGCVAAVHAGRLGVASGIALNAVEAMRAAGTNPADIRAAIGPAICGRCYEVPAQMRAELAQRVPEARAETSWGTPSLNLPAAVGAQLRSAGVRWIEDVGICTLESHDLYSYRRNPVTGRFAGVIRLKK